MKTALFSALLFAFAAAPAAEDDCTTQCETEYVECLEVYDENTCGSWLRSCLERCPPL
ncbi:hypothetical protein [Polyangium jinanense]|uniref:Uncharacterized protein n=1 Tax=Polyangium jinanense TaxID=2829994 RepID=A0A9X3XDE8_9BACT|nr:hypothetical protein [Polyangium jinanense]MDC3960173.1 hypothetical protein [Polyangium jinanense]MDC3986613.1 hypothetical protein [Polyangium jinanense]